MALCDEDDEEACMLEQQQSGPMPPSDEESDYGVVVGTSDAHRARHVHSTSGHSHTVSATGPPVQTQAAIDQARQERLGPSGVARVQQQLTDARVLASTTFPTNSNTQQGALPTPFQRPQGVAQLRGEGSNPPPMRQVALPVTPRDLPFMGALANQEWQTMAINEPYVPKIGTIFNERTFGPDPYSTILAMSTPCGRGKSTATHGYMIDDLIQRKPGARVLLLSANILYGTSLSAELRTKYRGSADIKVGFYRDERDEDLQKCNVVVCSLESLHRLDDQRFDAILIDEVRTIARLVGGATMTDFNNIYLLRELGAKAAEVIVCDADLMFRMDDSEPNTLAYDFMKLIFDKRPTLHASFPHRGPDHLRRKVKLLFDYGVKKKNPGKKAFFAELEKAVAAWHEDKTKRFAVNGGSKTQLSEVYNFLISLKVPVKPYSGETNEEAKFEDLKDPDSAWLAFGCIASTTSLSIGVDPKNIEFDRVFMWTHPMGCTVLAMFQAAMRFGRQAAHPLGNRTICILVKCIPPSVHAALVRAKKRKPIVPPTYEDEFKLLSRRRGAAARQAAKELASIGGHGVGMHVEKSISDQILRVMAHASLERKFQMVDHYTAVKRCIEQYGWEIEPVSLEEAEAPHIFNFDDLANVVEDEDDKFAAGSKEIEKWEWVVNEIVCNRGEERFFDNRCYELVTDQKSNPTQFKSGREQYLVKAYWLLKHVGRMPSSDGGLTPAEQLLEMGKPGVLDGLSLNAHTRCMDTATVTRSDAIRRNDPENALPHPLLQPAVGMRMDGGERLSKLLGIDSPYNDCDLPQSIVDTCRRETFKQSTDDDRKFRSDLKWLVNEMGVSVATLDNKPLHMLIEAAATACGMVLDGTETMQKENIHHPSATTKCGKLRVIKFLRFKRFLADMVDDWRLYSVRLGYSVCTAEWQRLHASIDEEEGQLGFDNDAELDADLLFSPPLNTGPQRTEKIDGNALKAELHRLSNLSHMTDQGKRWLDWLTAADGVATDPDANGVRMLTVVYGKSAHRVIGRRTASHPSMQHCPSGLRPLLVSHFYHDVDIVNCHPTLMLQVAEKMGVADEDLEPLREYVTHRQPMLDRIGAHYGVPAAKAKYAVLRVLNGGEITTWVNDRTVGCTRGKDEVQEDLRCLQETARLVRNAFFAMAVFKDHVAALRTELKDTTKAKVEAAQARVRAATTPSAREHAQRELGNARRKATPQAIARSVFSACIFELEDMVLDVIDKHFTSNGWVVSSLQFDGLHVEHWSTDTYDAVEKKWVQLDSAMCAAEVAVEERLGYKIKLSEKALYEHAPTGANQAGEEVDPFADIDDDAIDEAVAADSTV